MHTYSINRLFIRLGCILLALFMLVGENSITHAQSEQLFMGISFSQSLIGIGQTVKLSIAISNAAPNPVRVTSFQCLPSSSAVSTSAISPMPTTLTVEQTFLTSQTYRGVSVGTVMVHCEITAVDTVTSAIYTSTSSAVTLDVIPEMGLYFTANSATRVATVGQTVFVISKFGNRGKTAFTNLHLSCAELGRAMIFVSGTPLPSTIPPGQTGLVQDRWLAVRTGDGSMICSLTATESASGKSLTLTAPMINIMVK
jgi:hypothetical protein